MASELIPDERAISKEEMTKPATPRPPVVSSDSVLDGQVVLKFTESHRKAFREYQKYAQELSRDSGAHGVLRLTESDRKAIRAYQKYARELSVNSDPHVVLRVTESDRRKIRVAQKYARELSANSGGHDQGRGVLDSLTSKRATAHLNTPAIDRGLLADSQMDLDAEEALPVVSSLWKSLLSPKSRKKVFEVALNELVEDWAESDLSENSAKRRRRYHASYYALTATCVLFSIWERVAGRFPHPFRRPTR